MSRPITDTLPTDGRRARGERNKEAVVTAILELLDEGNERPGVVDIAARSGVSVRSVFRYFDDLESLYAAAIERHAERLRPLFTAIPTEGSLAERVQSLVRQRSRLYETMTPVRVVALRLRERSPIVASQLEWVRRLLRAQLRELFAVELGSVAPSGERELLDALEMATSWSAWNNLRKDQGCGVVRAEKAMACAARGMLTDI